MYGALTKHFVSFVIETEALALDFRSAVGDFQEVFNP